MAACLRAGRRKRSLITPNSVAPASNQASLHVADVCIAECQWTPPTAPTLFLALV